MEGLWKKLGELGDALTPKECRNYLNHVGYKKIETSKTIFNTL